MIKLNPIISTEEARTISTNTLIDSGLTLDDRRIGEIVTGKGVYLGVWSPKDKDGKCLGKTFNLFAKEKDISSPTGSRLSLSFDGAAKLLSTTENSSGCILEEDLYDAIKTDKYNNGWFIPTLEIMQDYIVHNKDRGSLKNTLDTNPNPSGFSDWYLTSKPFLADHIYYVSMSRGDNNFLNKDRGIFNVRLVRAEPRP